MIPSPSSNDIKQGGTLLIPGVADSFKTLFLDILKPVEIDVLNSEPNCIEKALYHATHYASSNDSNVPGQQDCVCFTLGNRFNGILIAAFAESSSVAMGPRVGIGLCVTLHAKY